MNSNDLARLAVLILVVPVLVVLAGACSGPASLRGVRVRVSYDSAASIPASGNFDFAGLVHVPEGDRRIDAAPVELRLRTAVIRELTRKGYRYRASQPVFLVDLQIESEEPLGPDDPPRSGFEAGALTLQMLDLRDKRALWQGVCEVRALIGVPEEEKDERVDYVVRRLLQQFPPPASSGNATDRTDRN